MQPYATHAQRVSGGGMIRTITGAALLCAIAGGCSVPWTAVSPAGAPTPVPTAHGDSGIQLTETERVRREGMTCLQATRAARTALVRLGYLIDEVEKASFGNPGRIHAHKETGWAPASPEPAERHPASVEVSCDDAGATLVLFTDAGLLARPKLGRRFADAVREVRVRRPRPPRPAAAGGIVIHVTPVFSGGAGEPPFPLAPGLAALHVRIENRTEREYRLPPDGVRIVSTGGRRITVRLDEPPAGTPPETRSQLLQPGVLVPGATRAGYVLGPAAAYRRVSVRLIDTATGETEGFRAEL